MPELGRRVAQTKWFKRLQANASAVAKARGIEYPNKESDVNRDVHAQAEARMGHIFEKIVREEMGW